MTGSPERGVRVPEILNSLQFERTGRDEREGASSRPRLRKGAGKKKEAVSDSAQDSASTGGSNYCPEMTPAMEKTGRYMEITMPPHTPPRKTIIIGSINWVSPSTAASTSSS